VALVIGGTLLFVVFVWTDAIPLLRGPEEWRWTLRTLTQPVWRLLLPLAILALYALVAARWIVTFRSIQRARAAVGAGLSDFPHGGCALISWFWQQLSAHAVV